MFLGSAAKVSGSVGILADNSYGSNANSDFVASYRTIVKGWDTGIESVQSVASDVPNTMYLDRLQVAGNNVGYQFGPSVAGGNVQVVGQVNTTDPINDPDGTTMATGWLPNLTVTDADALQFNPDPASYGGPYSDDMFVVTFASGTLVTTSAAYSWPDGMGVRIREADGPNHAMPLNIGNNTRYWIHKESPTTFSLYTTQANALSQTSPISNIDWSTVTTAVGISELVVPGTDVGGNPPYQPKYVITDPAKARPDVTTSGNLTLGAGATWVPMLGGDTATSSVAMEDFNAFDFTWAFTSSDVNNVNPWGPGFVSKTKIGTWGNTNQPGDGALHIGDSGTGEQEIGGAYELRTTSQDVSQMGYLRVIAKLGGGSNTSDEFLVTMVDIDGTSDLHYFPTSALGPYSPSGTYTTLFSNILSPPVRFVDGDNVLNLSAVAGWAVSGAFGSTDGVGSNDSISLVVDDISYVPAPCASSIDVTGTVDITDSVFAPTDSVNLWASSIGQTFTVLNNDGIDAIIGTFAGVPEGGTVNAGHSKYSVSYVGGTGNDIVLTQVADVAPVVDLNSGTGGIDNAVTWTNPTPVNIATSGTVADADDTTLASMTATLDTVSTGDVLAAAATGNISVSYNATSGVLTMSGTDTVANYQTVLNSITYNNTNGGPGVNKTVTVVADDGAGGLSTAAVSTITTVVPLNSTVAGRFIFYNNSGFDGGNAGIQTTIAGPNNDDEDARDTSKVALLPGAGAATWANITGYDKGINGIMIDLSTGVDHSGLTLANVAANFIFKVGNNSTPSGWAVAPAPNGLSVIPGGGLGGTDRVEITWGTGVNGIYGKWLEVGVLPTAQTGLADSGQTIDPDGPGVAGAVAVGDVFFFGNAVGGSGDGDTVGAAPTNTADEFGARNNPKGFGNFALVDFVYDYNKDRQVNTADQLLSRNNGTGFGTQLVKINIGTAGPLAPEDGGDTGIASALASTATTSTVSTSNVASLPPGISHRLAGLDLNSGRIATFFQHLADQDTPGTRKILTKIDAVADELGLDDHVLDGLLASLGLE